MKLLIAIILLFISYILFAAEVKKAPDETKNTVNEKAVYPKADEDTGRFIAVTRFDSARILFWSGYGATATAGFINVFAHLGYAYNAMEDLKSLENELRQTADYDFSSYDQFYENYPAVIFGLHFLFSGLTAIPYIGGILYGISMYFTAITFCVFRAINPLRILGTLTLPNTENIINRLETIYEKIFDPAPYFVIGTLSLLFGVFEIITTLYYLREIKKRKYPYMQKIFTFSPFGIIIRLDA